MLVLAMQIVNGAGVVLDEKNLTNQHTEREHTEK